MFARIPIERHPALVNVLLRECGVYIDLEELDRAREACRDAANMTAAVHGEHHAQWFALLLRRANLALSSGDVAAARADFDSARTLATSDPPIGDRATLLGVVAAWQSRSRWLLEEHAAQRDDLLALLYPADGSGQLGARSPGSFQFAAFAAVACRFAPGGECARDPAALARQLITEPAARDSALRLPARLALAELALADDQPAPAIAPLESLLTELDGELPAGHSLRAQALLTLAALKSQSGDAAGARRDATAGRQLLAQLPAGHPLHAHRWLLERVPGG